MLEPRKSASPRRRGGMAGGSLLALSTVIGVVVGIAYRQSSVGFLIGLGVGALLLLLIFLLDRRR